MSHRIGSNWRYVWDPDIEDGVKQFQSEEEYNTFMSMIRRSSFGEHFTSIEQELMTLLLYIDTNGFEPHFHIYRESFIRDYHNLKQTMVHERGGAPNFDFDGWARHMSTIELKVDIQTLVLHGRKANSCNGQDGVPDLDPRLLNLLINFCQETAFCILQEVMLAQWNKDLGHASACEHLGKNFSWRFKAWRQPCMEEEIDYIKRYIRFDRDNNLVRFMDDLMFLLTEIYLKLHDGHANCNQGCVYRTKMGAKLRALFFYGCLGADPLTSIEVKQHTLREMVCSHIVDDPSGQRTNLGIF
ncbi:hypothetical protein BDZ91DRAFT_848584 [Kalaharituber pfeilii]|nr:hypothetical protein BDZ91DRAFT_848584 [Kalaharituber pfeilii]